MMLSLKVPTPDKPDPNSKFEARLQRISLVRA